MIEIKAPPAQPPERDDSLRQRFIEEYMLVASGFYFEGSNEEDERRIYAPEFADKMLALFRTEVLKARIDERRRIDSDATRLQDLKAQLQANQQEES